MRGLAGSLLAISTFAPASAWADDGATAQACFIERHGDVAQVACGRLIVQDDDKVFEERFASGGLGTDLQLVTRDRFADPPRVWDIDVRFLRRTPSGPCGALDSVVYGSSGEWGDEALALLRADAKSLFIGGSTTCVRLDSFGEVVTADPEWQLVNEALPIAVAAQPVAPQDVVEEPLAVLVERGEEPAEAVGGVVGEFGMDRNTQQDPGILTFGQALRYIYDKDGCNASMVDPQALKVWLSSQTTPRVLDMQALVAAGGSGAVAARMCLRGAGAAYTDEVGFYCESDKVCYVQPSRGFPVDCSRFERSRGAFVSTGVDCFGNQVDGDDRFVLVPLGSGVWAQAYMTREPMPANVNLIFASGRFHNDFE